MTELNYTQYQALLTIEKGGGQCPLLRIRNFNRLDCTFLTQQRCIEIPPISKGRWVKITEKGRADLQAHEAKLQAAKDAKEGVSVARVVIPEVQGTNVVAAVIDDVNFMPRKEAEAAQGAPAESAPALSHKLEKDLAFGQLYGSGGKLGELLGIQEEALQARRAELLSSGAQKASDLGIEEDLAFASVGRPTGEPISVTPLGIPTEPELPAVENSKPDDWGLAALRKLAGSKAPPERSPESQKALDALNAMSEPPPVVVKPPQPVAPAAPAAPPQPAPDSAQAIQDRMRQMVPGSGLIPVVPAALIADPMAPNRPVVPPNPMMNPQGDSPFGNTAAAIEAEDERSVGRFFDAGRDASLDDIPKPLRERPTPDTFIDPKVKL